MRAPRCIVNIGAEHIIYACNRAFYSVFQRVSYSHSRIDKIPYHRRKDDNKGNQQYPFDCFHTVSV